MQQNNKLETVRCKKPRKWNVINNLSQVFVAHSFWVICRNVSCTFVELCMDAILMYCTTATRNPQKHLEFTFSIKALSFHWESSIRAHKHILEMVILLKIRRSSLFSSRQHSYFSVTHCENSEVEIVVFCKWNMLQDWKLVQTCGEA